MASRTDLPDWVRDAVFYQIFPDRFAKSNRVEKPQNLEPWESEPTEQGYKGGDLYGIIEHLDHIEELGVNALYLNPVFQAASNHRYNTHDYYRVDPMLGGNQALRELLDACHSRGIRVILDGVFNHVGRGFFQFSDILENGSKSPYVNWFHIHSFPLNAYNPEKRIGYTAWWGLPTLPKFNTETPAVREFLWDVATHWLKFGIDGWRLDVPNEIDDDDFWREFCLRCREVNPECYLVGEIWDDATRWLQSDQFNAVTNYEFARAVLGFVGRHTLNQEEIQKCGYKHITPLTAKDYSNIVKGLLTQYPQRATNAQLNFIGSHDTPRVLTITGEDETAVGLAFVLLMTFPGAPLIYYGDEIGMKGRHDPGNRYGMPWERQENWNRDLLEHTKRLARLRRAHQALRRGTYLELDVRRDLYVFARCFHPETFIVALNTSQASTRVEFPITGKPEFHGQYEDVLSGASATVDEGMFKGPVVPGRTGALFFRAKPY